MLRPILLVPLATALAACGSSPEKPALETATSALSVSACPLEDVLHQPVTDIFPGEAVFQVTNRGKAAATLTGTFSGPDAQAFTTSGWPATLAPGASAELAVHFTPPTPGSHEATLTVDDGDSTTAALTLALTGEGSMLEGKPVLRVEYEGADGGFAECAGSCIVDWPGTLVGESSALTLRVTNAGCPTLEVTGLTVDRYEETDPTVDFALESPAVPPSEGTPWRLTPANGDARELVVRFTPKDDGAGEPTRRALLRLTSNDFYQPTQALSLFGTAVKPSFFVQPQTCFFEDTDRCDLTITNGSAAETMTVSAVTLLDGTGRFVADAGVVGVEIAAGGSAPAEVLHSGGDLFMKDRVAFSATQLGADAGTVLVTLLGGKRPELSTTPADQLTFEAPATRVTELPVTIHNAAGAGTLVVERVVVEQSHVFALAEGLPAGTPIAGGASAQVLVRYTKPTSGGLHIGALRIETNDPDHALPSPKTVILYSESPLDELPVARLRGKPEGEGDEAYQSGTLAVSLAALGGTPSIQLSGATSSDPQPGGGTAPATAFLFSLIAKPAAATTASLSDDRVQTSSDTPVLTLHPGVRGEYRVALRVYDDAEQPSANLADLRIYVGP